MVRKLATLAVQGWRFKDDGSNCGSMLNIIQRAQRRLPLPLHIILYSGKSIFYINTRKEVSFELLNDILCTPLFYLTSQGEKMKKRNNVN